MKSEVPAPKSATSTSSSFVSCASYASAAAIGSIRNRTFVKPAAIDAESSRCSASASAAGSGWKLAGRPITTSSSEVPALFCAFSRSGRRIIVTSSSRVTGRLRIWVAWNELDGSHDFTDWMNRPALSSR